MSKMLENSQKSQIPDNNKEETNMSLALSLENVANQGGKGNKGTKLLIRNLLILTKLLVKLIKLLVTLIYLL